jgi:hypothetical protein
MLLVVVLPRGSDWRWRLASYLGCRRRSMAACLLMLSCSRAASGLLASSITLLQYLSLSPTGRPHAL